MTMHLPVTGSYALELALWLVSSHFVGDFVLQSEWLARAKDRHSRPDQTGTTQTIWPYALLAHGFAHGFLVMLATGQIVVALGETGLHGLIDFSKCEGFFGIHKDQVLHLACKAAWWILVVWGLV